MHTQVLHVGQLVSLQTLNVAHNFLSDLTTTGLCACGALSDLNLTANAIARRDSLAYLGLLPALQSLRMSDNPVSADKYYRCEGWFCKRCRCWAYRSVSAAS